MSVYFLSDRLIFPEKPILAVYPSQPINLSSFLFRSAIRAIIHLSRPPPFSLYFYLGNRMSAPKECPCSYSVIFRAISTFLRINLNSFSKRAIFNDSCKNLRWHIKTIYQTLHSVNYPLSTSNRSLTPTSRNAESATHPHSIE